MHISDLELFVCGLCVCESLGAQARLEAFSLASVASLVGHSPREFALGFICDSPPQEWE